MTMFQLSVVDLNHQLILAGGSASRITAFTPGLRTSSSSRYLCHLCCIRTDDNMLKLACHRQLNIEL